MAISSYKSFLMIKEDSTWTKLIDIKEFPDMGGAPEMLETTTLSDRMQTFIKGIQSNEAKTFTANYTKADFTTLKGYESSQKEYALWLGGTESEGVLTPTGTDGKFTFTGELSVYLNGKSVNQVDEMTITIAPTTVIDFA